MLHLYGQGLPRRAPKRRGRRAVSLTQPHIFNRFEEPSKHSIIQPYSSKKRKVSDRNDGITVNVSGKKYFFTGRLLSLFPNSLLAHRRKRAFFYDSIRDELFFDRNRTAFETVFHFYVSKGRLMFPDENFPEQLLADELYFFGLYEYINEDIKKTKLALPSALTKRQVMPLRKCQREVWKIFEVPDSNALARLVNLFSLLVIVCSAIILCVDTLPTFRNYKAVTLASNAASNTSKNSSYGNHSTKTQKIGIVHILEASCISWFTLELIARFSVSPEKRKFFVQALNIIDLVVIVPFYISLFISFGSIRVSLYILRILRLSRVFRVLKISRYVTTMKVLGKTFKDSIGDLWTMLFLNIIGTVLFGSIAYYCEQWHEGTKFESIPVSCWWAMVTITTLGYGDIVPKTLGKNEISLVGLFLSLVSIHSSVVWVTFLSNWDPANRERFYLNLRGQLCTGRSW